MTQTPMAKTPSPQSFTTQAATIGNAEIELGQLALQKTRDPSVREYARRMVRDHQPPPPSSSRSPVSAAADAAAQGVRGGDAADLRNQ